MSEKAKCPHCGVVIDHLEYKEEGRRFLTEYYDSRGTCKISGDDKNEDDCNYGDNDCDDSEVDTTYFYCPKCDAEITDIDDLEVISDDEVAVHRTPPKPNPSADSSDLIDSRHSHNSQSLTFFVCIKCETKVEVLGDDDGGGSFNGKSKHGEREVRCTKCGKRITAKTSKLIIKV